MKFSQALTQYPSCQLMLKRFDRFTWIFCSAVLFWHSVLFYTCNVWIGSICFELKEVSLPLSGFWLLLKSRPKHYLTQQRSWWKFLLEAALSQPTVGILLGFGCVTLCRNLGSFPPFCSLLHCTEFGQCLMYGEVIRNHLLSEWSEV